MLRLLSTEPSGTSFNEIWMNMKILSVKKNAFEIVVYKILAIFFKPHVLMKNSSHAAKNTQPCYKGILFPSQHNI